MILPGLAPHHTRSSMGSRGRLYIEKYSPTLSNFTETEDGLWLLHPSIAERDREKGIIVLDKVIGSRQANDLDKHKTDKFIKASRLLGRTVITNTGCMVGGLRGNQQPHDFALQLAEWDWGSPPFDTAEDLPYLSACDTDDCYNARHYDIEFSRPTLKERKVEINPNNYKTLPDGRIVTIWGDILPSVKDSMDYYIQFQRANYPFVPIIDSRLSATSMSQVRFQPITGCWESWQYYCKPQDNLNWQFDGYGRLYQKFTTRGTNQETGEIMNSQRRGHWMAHRVIWAASGRQLKVGQVLNHKCSYRRCCNPLHIEQVTASSNVHHGIRAQTAKKTVDQETVYTPPRERVALNAATLALYNELAYC